jgi:3'(2'), 5'-bisphosphate nucleotidase
MQTAANIEISKIIEIAQQAGHLVMLIYHQSSLEVSHKADRSALTRADIESHTFIYQSLQRLYPGIPILSEEADDHHAYTHRKDWDYFFLIDPLDGTKEFIKRNHEFTINIALIKNNQPILGVIYAPAINILYYAEQGKGAFKLENKEQVALPRDTLRTHNTLRVAVSRSHACTQTETFLKILARSDNEIITIPSGSALKFGLIAEGSADIYPRFGPTMEWDTAAGHVLINEVGKKISLINSDQTFNSDQTLVYNKQELVNPAFVVS